ncbi:hypothetical protein V6M85_04770 [Sulfolobus tengchongensis]|uniref:Uncharacterized protein n=1 Tax=Sulfolobus tengchongensis TaxID=207809 RepID=A0AAX4L3H3_9CREN
MKASYTLPLSIVMIVLPIFPALVNSFPAFLADALIDFIIATYILITEKPWANDIKTAISTLYFTALATFADTAGVFFVIAYQDPFKFALVTLVLSIPFIYNLFLVLKQVLPSVIKSDILYVGNGFFAFVLVLIIGAVIGRLFITNFYALLPLYTGFLILAIIALFYFRKK